MRELSLHILDIVQNSIAAGASLVRILVTEDTRQDRLVIEIGDNGRGMSPELVAAVTDPFVTSRTTRKVGLGIPLFKAAAESCAGSFILWSQEGSGTKVKATFQRSHIDRMPLGDMASTIYTVIVLNPHIDVVYTQTLDGGSFTLDTREVKQQLEMDTLSHPQVLSWVREYLKEGVESINREG